MATRESLQALQQRMLATQQDDLRAIAVRLKSDEAERRSARAAKRKSFKDSILEGLAKRRTSTTAAAQGLEAAFPDDIRTPSGFSAGNVIGATTTMQEALPQDIRTPSGFSAGNVVDAPAPEPEPEPEFPDVPPLPKRSESVPEPMSRRNVTDNVTGRPRETEDIARRVESTSSSDTATRLMSDLQRDFGLSDEQAAGFVGNLAHESGNFKQLQEVKPVVPGSKGGFGFAQWTGPRRREFESWTAARDLDPRSYEANYGFLRHELENTSEGRVLGPLRAASNVDEATRVVQDKFLRPGIPHTSSRLRRARSLVRAD